MLPEQKEKITKNFVPLIQECNVQELSKKLVKRNVFTEQELKEIFASQDFRHNKRLFFFALQKKPQSAFNHLIQALKESAQSSLADILSPKPFDLNTGCKVFHPIVVSKDEEESDDEPVEVDVTSPTSNINFDLIPTEIKVVCSSEFHDTKEKNGNVDTYRCRSKKRGRLLIINNYDFSGTKHQYRTGATVDVQNLEQLFNQMGGWDVEIYSNQTSEQMLLILKDFTAYRMEKKCDICFVIVMSHGNEYLNNTIIYGIDGKYITTSQIEDHFTNENCKLFRGVPKVLLFQVCRGADIDINIPATESDGERKTETDGERKTETDGEQKSSEIRRAVEDMLIGYATLIGYKAHRDPQHGTWYVDLICQIFMEHACDHSVEKLLMMVDQRLRKRMSEKRSLQTSEHCNRGCKRLYLNPGIYQEGGVKKKFF